MIKLKKLLIKEEVDRKALKQHLKDAIDATNKLSIAINGFLNVFTRYHKDVRSALGDPLWVMINKTINVKGKVNKLLGVGSLVFGIIGYLKVTGGRSG